MKITARLFQMLMFSLLVMGFLPYLAKSEEKASLDALANYKKEADEILNQEVVPNMQVKALTDNRELTEKNSEGAVVVATTNYLGLRDFRQPSKIEINFSGNKVTPQTPIIISFNSEPEVIRKSIVDNQGQWAIKIPVHILPHGNNAAYIQTEKEGVRSKAVAVATFNVYAEQNITRQTWYFIIFVVIAIITLLFAIILQLIRNAKNFEPDSLI